MSVTDVVVAAGQIGAALLPTFIDALSGGTPAEVLTHAMIVTAQEVALRRVEAHGEGGHPHPLALEARKIEDRADVLEHMGEKLPAAELRCTAAELRRRAAVRAPTGPAPVPPLAAVIPPDPASEP